MMARLREKRPGKSIEYKCYKLNIYRNLAPKQVTFETFARIFGEPITLLQFMESCGRTTVTENVLKEHEKLIKEIQRSAFKEYKNYSRIWYT